MMYETNLENYTCVTCGISLTLDNIVYISSDFAMCEKCEEVYIETEEENGV